MKRTKEREDRLLSTSAVDEEVTSAVCSEAGSASEKERGSDEHKDESAQTNPSSHWSMLDTYQKASLNSEAPSKVGCLDTQMLMPGNTSALRRSMKDIWSTVMRGCKDGHRLLEQSRRHNHMSLDGSGHDSEFPPSSSSRYTEKEKEALHSPQSPQSYLEGKADLPSVSFFSLNCVKGAYLFCPPIVASSFCIPPPNITPSSPFQEAFKQSISPKGQSNIKPTVAGPPCPENSPVATADSTVSTTKATFMDACRYSCSDSETQSGCNTPGEMVPLTTTGHSSATDPLPALCYLRISDSLRNPFWNSMPDFHNMPSMSQIPLTKNNMRSHCLPDMLQDNFERFTPDISADEKRETYRFQCSSPGLYQCSVTGLVFNMEGEGDVTYRIVPWNQMLLTQHHKKPAGPLFDIKCQQQSVCQLHLPHCEIHSTGGCEFLSVAHVTDDVTDFILPHKITETHVIINITGFSFFGIVKDKKSPPDPIQAVVLPFYTPPVDPGLTSLLNVLLLPGNIVLRDVLHKRKKLNADERYIEINPYCKLQPNQEYKLSSSPQDDSILTDPGKAEFVSESYDNYFPTFQVFLEQIMKQMKLLLTDNNSLCVWERRVCLSSGAIRRSQVQNCQRLPSDEKLISIRSDFIQRVSLPTLKNLLDNLFEKKEINDAERERASEISNRADKATFVIDTVRMKGEQSSSVMIKLMIKEDFSLSEQLGLI